MKRFSPLLAIAAVFFSVLPAYAQAPTVLLPTEAFAFNYPDTALTAESIERFEVQYDGGAWVSLGVPAAIKVSTTAGVSEYKLVPPQTTGTHTFALRACNLAGCTVATAPFGFAPQSNPTTAPSTIHKIPRSAPVGGDAPINELGFNEAALCDPDARVVASALSTASNFMKFTKEPIDRYEYAIVVIEATPETTAVVGPIATIYRKYPLVDTAPICPTGTPLAGLRPHALQLPPIPTPGEYTLQMQFAHKDQDSGITGFSDWVRMDRLIVQ